MEETFEPSITAFIWIRGTSLFETLETVSAEEASIPVGGKCASLAAQVAHVIFYIEVMGAVCACREITARAIGARSGAPWKRSLPKNGRITRANSKMPTGGWTNFSARTPTWNDDTIGGALSIVVHTAYHLGEIRQALCTLK